MQINFFCGDDLDFLPDIKTLNKSIATKLLWIYGALTLYKIKKNYRLFVFKKRCLWLSMTLAMLGACNLPGNKLNVPNVESDDFCKGLPTNAMATVETKALFKGLLSLSCGEKQGVISGQNAGHGDQINDAQQIMGYDQAVKVLVDRDGFTPGILGVDYEHDRIYNQTQLRNANKILIDHAQAGGIVTITWSPLSPWVNDGRDLEVHPGDWLETRTPINNPEGKATVVNLSELVTPGHPMNKIWRARLDKIAAALAELQAARVPVLWRPMQEMAGTHFWWGANLPLSEASGYVALWRDMHRYFTEEKQLNNLLWVFSPEAHDRAGRDVFWAYPGDDVVDVIAPTRYSLALDIPSYKTLSARARAARKPLAMGEYGPPVWGEGFLPVLPSAPLIFDAKKYSRLLTDYPDVAYWVSWHSYYVDAEKISRLSLSDSAFTKELFLKPGILNRDQLEFIKSIP
jgi:mannan endo-1,4-beta-mannosidase